MSRKAEALRVMGPKQALALITLVFATVLALAPLGIAGGQQQNGALEAASQDYVEQRGEQWAGWCDQTAPDQHIGMWCGKVQSQTENEAVVNFGQTFSQFQVTVTFERTNGEWQTVDEEGIPEPGEPINGEDERYMVEAGDTLFSIAQGFGVTVDAIVERNDIEDPDLIHVEDVLIIPEPETEYTVQAGDTLFSIAQQHGVSVDAIAERNNIEDTAVIFAGQVLIIPEGVMDPPGDPAVPVCLQGGGFVEDGHIAVFDREAGDASEIGEFRHATHDGCERLVIDLVTEERNPAIASGGIQAELLRDLGVVRIHLGDEYGLQAFIDGPTEAEFDGDLMQRAFAVRGLEDNSFIDVHLGEAALARVLLLQEQARIVVDAQPGGEALGAPAAINDLMVVLTPREGDNVSYPLVIQGYGRTFEANVIGLIRTNEEIDVEDFTTAASWAETWGQFELVLDDGPLGNIELFVGERSAKDGTEQGVRLNLNVE